MGRFTRVTVIIAAALLSGASCVTRPEPAPPVTCLSIAQAPIAKGYQGIKSQTLPNGIWMGAYQGKEGIAVVIIAPKAAVSEAERAEADGECLDPQGRVLLHKTQYLTNQQMLELAPQTNGVD